MDLTKVLAQYGKEKGYEQQQPKQDVYLEINRPDLQKLQHGSEIKENDQTLFIIEM